MGYGVPDSGVDFYYVTAEEAYMLHKNNMCVMVDARDDSDFAASHIQCSFHIPANTLILDNSKIDQGMVKHILELIAAGKTLIALSDTCITGAKNRGHVSRCRHICQYFVEIGADKSRCMRMTGGINRWKQRRLDGIIGDLRPMFAGAFQAEDFMIPQDEHALEDAGDEEEAPERELEDVKAFFGDVGGGTGIQALPRAPAAPAIDDAASSSEPLPLMDLMVGCTVEVVGLKARADLNGKKASVMSFIEENGRWEIAMMDDSKEHVRVKPDNLVVQQEKPKPVVAVSDLPRVKVLRYGDPKTGEQVFAEVFRVAVKEWRKNVPTAYRVLRGELYKKPSKESDKIIKLDRPISTIIPTTGEVWVGMNGGSWAELDVTAGEKKGWIYIEGPGFGASSKKIRTEYLRP